MRIIILIVTLLFSFGMNAQEEKESKGFIIGGSASFAAQDNYAPFSTIGILPGVGTVFSSRVEDSQNLFITINPYFGKQVNEHWLVGVDFDAGLRRTENLGTDFIGGGELIRFEDEQTQLGFGVFGRYIFSPQKKVKLFLEPSLGYGLGNQKSFRESELDQEEKSNFVSVALGGGVLYEVNDRIRLTLRQSGLSYVRGSWEIIDTELNNDFQSFSGNFRLSSFSLGVELKF